MTAMKNVCLRALHLTISAAVLAIGLSAAKPATAASGVDGIDPIGALQFNSSDGYFYGVTEVGGLNDDGTVYKIKPDGTSYSVIYEFAGSDGHLPDSLVIVGGNLYVTTQTGGSNNDGALVEMDTSGGSFSVLFNFSGSNGAFPISLISDGSSNLYGVCYHGGNGSSEGTVWAYNLSSGFSVLHTLTSSTDGAHPDGPLTLDGSTLYGTCVDGGNGYGSIFSVTTGGTFTSMCLFNASGDGCYPHGQLTAISGVLYGTTTRGIGTGYGGNIFTINETSPYNQTSLYNLGTTCVFPLTQLITDSTTLQGSGYLYGTSEGDNSSSAGAVYSYNIGTNTVTALATLPAPAGSQGSSPGPLAQDTTTSAFYFTSPTGGPTNSGILYKMTSATNNTLTVLHNFNTITRDTTVGATGARSTSVTATLTTHNPNEVVIANMTAGIQTASTFTGPSDIVIGGTHYSWSRVSSSSAVGVREELWSVVVPTATSQTVTFTFLGSSNPITAVMDAYAGADPNLPSTHPGIDAIGTAASFTLASGTAAKSGGALSTTNAYSYLAAYTGYVTGFSGSPATAGTGYVGTSSSTFTAIMGVLDGSYGELGSPAASTGSQTAPTFNYSASAPVNTTGLIEDLALRVPNT